MKAETVSLFVLAVYIIGAAGQELSLSVSTLTIDEGDSEEVCLNVANSSMIEGTATVTLRTVDSDDTIGDEDYSSINQEFSLTSSVGDERCITIQILQDDVVEAIEFFTITLENPVGIALGNSQTVVVINQDDSDVITVDFSSTIFNGTEGQGVSVCVTVLSGSVGRPLPVTVGLSATDVTTRGLEDYGNLASRLIQVVDGTMTGDTVCTSLGLTDDSIVEPEEIFTLSLVAVQFEPVTVTDKTANITIIDNDMAIVNVSSPLSVVEGSSGLTEFDVEVELQIGSVPLARDVIVTLSTEDGSATVGSDYEAMTADFTFKSGSANGVSMIVAVPIIGDEIGEPDETFIISITPSTPDMATAATITIINDDRDCPDLSAPANGSVSMSGIIEGSIATYSCNTGYILVGNVERTCENDIWTGTEPICQVGCPPLTNPPAGSVNVPSLLQDSTATYTCNEGYMLIGDALRTCGATGMWTGNEPVCQIIDCGSPPTVDNGTPNIVGTTFGEIVTYTCDDGYQLATLTSQRECLITRVWSSGDIRCEAVDCGVPPGVGNGSPDFDSTMFGAVATYTCDEGYRLATPDNQITCLGSGSWSSNDDILCEAEEDEEEDDEGLEGGAIAGIVIAVVVVIVVVAVVAVVLGVFLWRRYRAPTVTRKVPYSTEDVPRDGHKFDPGPGVTPDSTGDAGVAGEGDLTGDTGETGDFENGIEIEQSNENLMTV